MTNRAIKIAKEKVAVGLVDLCVTGEEQSTVDNAKLEDVFSKHLQTELRTGSKVAVIRRRTENHSFIYLGANKEYDPG